jgi:hypothetical protein
MLLRAGQVAMGLLHSAEFLVADAQIAQPFGVCRILRGEAFGDGERGGVMPLCAGQIALRLLHSAEFDLADEQIALLLGIRRILRDEAFADG